jgi:hypothetical protein
MLSKCNVVNLNLNPSEINACVYLNMGNSVFTFLSKVGKIEGDEETISAKLPRNIILTLYDV